MINVSVERECGRIRRVYAKGHSLYAKKGMDIVCAGVSAILQTAVLGLDAHLPKGRFLVSSKDGMLDIKIGKLGDEEAKATVILETMLLGLKCIEHDHPAYVRIIERG